MKHLKLAMLVPMLMVLSGCSSLPIDWEKFENRVSCTKGGGIALYSSMYGMLGITSKVAPTDAAVICAAPVPPVPSK